MGLNDYIERKNRDSGYENTRVQFVQIVRLVTFK